MTTSTAPNINPIYPLTGKASWTTVTTANTAMDGTGTVATVFTAQATCDARVDKLRISYSGTAVATCLRVWINNGSTNATATNNSFVTDVSIPACASFSQTTTNTNVVLPLDIVVPAGYKLNITIGTTVANALMVLAEAGDYA